MICTVRILEEAAEEAAEAAAWYEQERPGLGARFYDAIEAALDLLEQDVIPLAAWPGTAGTRSAKHLPLRRFPYSIIVHERERELIVVAFAHQARQPGYWKHRIRR